MTTKPVNKQRNEILVTLGDYQVKCKMTFSAIVQIEELFDSTIFQIVQKLNQGNIRIDKIADVIEIASIDDIDREELEEAILDTGAVDAITAIVPLLLSAFAGGGNKKETDTSKKN